MNKLMPILTAYWGAECKYDTPRGRLNVIFNHYTVHLFSQENINAKLHLRPLWSITEYELRDLGKVLDIERIEVAINTQAIGSKKLVKDRSFYESEFCVYGDGSYVISALCPARAINHLRAKGFCVDQELVDAGLVEWKQTN